ncbi:hypothetical protein K435DRAFT_811415 [Dendrothele bispora CBS 962.96]|uniref:CCHC-type domain-containing protein n=1 Tax=Dendrothele bispora (strain CBS 962.96) TaxID=1314807 RepID=A0A4V4HB98_DENBC|nr:hypothetical protein K435DRAFT_811415 [Dendrothele bispora CBS 962.96]
MSYNNKSAANGLLHGDGRFDPHERIHPKKHQAYSSANVSIASQSTTHLARWLWCRFRHVASELKARKDPPSEAQSISTLLKALPDTQDWKDFCRTTRCDIQADDLDFVIREVLREYRQQSRGDKKNDRDGDDDGGNEAMATMGQGKPRGFVAGAPDHTPIFKRPHLKCNLCGGVGHYRSQCPSELWTPGTKSANVSDEVHMAGLAISGEDYSGPGVAL